MQIFFILNIYCIQPNITIYTESNKHFLEKKRNNAKKIAIFLYAPNKDALLLAKKKGTIIVYA